MAKFIRTPSGEIVNLDSVFRVIRVGLKVQFIGNNEYSHVNFDVEEEAVEYFEHMSASLTY